MDKEHQYRSVSHECALIALVLIYGCSDKLNNQSAVEKYIKLCTEVSTSQRQIESCECMALEYDKVLNKKEYTALSAMMEILEKKTRFMTKGQPPIKMKFGTTGVDERALVSAMKKTQSLHRSGVCGYVQKLK